MSLSVSSRPLCVSDFGVCLLGHRPPVGSSRIRKEAAAAAAVCGSCCCFLQQRQQQLLARLVLLRFGGSKEPLPCELKKDADRRRRRHRDTKTLLHPQQTEHGQRLLLPLEASCGASLKDATRHLTNKGPIRSTTPQQQRQHSGQQLLAGGCCCFHKSDAAAAAAAPAHLLLLVLL